MSTRVRRPRFDTDQASDLARQYFGLEATASELSSERDQNFLLRDDRGTRRVLKLFNALEHGGVLDLQNVILRRFAARPCEYRFPELVPAADGRDLVEVEGDGETYSACLLTWVDGVLMASARPRSRQLARELGDLLGNVSSALDGLQHEAADRSLKWNLLHARHAFEAGLPLLRDDDTRERVDRLRSRFEEHVDPLLPELRSSVIHNDGNDRNVIVGPLQGEAAWPQRRVVGLIDVGDALQGPTVGELAVGLAYAMLDRNDPMEIARDVVGAYHQVFPLLEAEVDVLFDLVLMRLCLSVCNAAQQHAADPDNDYLLISQRSVLTALSQLETIDRGLAACHLRHACGWEPSAAGAELRRWLRARRGSFAGVVEPESESAVEVLDLSVGSTDMGGGAPGMFEAATLNDRLCAEIRNAGATLGVGSYDETRCWYGGGLFAAPGNEAPRRRTVHLGIDLFAAPGTPVHAPLAGTLASARVNAGRLDYGPTIVLLHEPEDGRPFHTLYGHLSADSLTGLEPGSTVETGARIGAVGDFPDNGGWPPHLHFQVIADPVGLEGDFPGVSTPDERAIFKSLSPDPDLILGLLAQPEPPQPAQTQLLARRKAHLGPSLSIAYRQPLTMVRGAGQFLYDIDGQPFLDAVNNVPHVGHAHPRVVAAARRQDAVLNTNTRYLHDNIVRYAERLTATPPRPDSRFASSSAPGARPTSWRFAWRALTRASAISSRWDGAYHGNTSSLVDLSPYKHAGPGGSGPSAVGARRLHARPLSRAACRERGRRRSLRRRRRSLLRPRPQAWQRSFAEPLLGCGGQIVPPGGYLARAFDHVHSAGGVCIADEVQIGFGRAGSHFWAFDAMEAVPDIVTPRQAHRQRLSARRGGDHTRRRRFVCQRHGVLQHFRRQSGRQRRGPRGPRRDRGGRLAGQRPCCRCSPPRQPSRAAAPSRFDRRRSWPRTVRWRRVGPRSGNTGACGERGFVHDQPHA